MGTGAQEVGARAGKLLCGAGKSGFDGVGGDPTRGRWLASQLAVSCRVSDECGAHCMLTQCPVMPSLPKLGDGTPRDTKRWRSVNYKFSSSCAP